MQTILKNTEDPSSIREASRILKEGGLVAFPTETVYGLGGNALDPSASARIYAAKGRPSDNPLIVHIAETSALEELAEEIPEKAHQLAEAFWPGPLTIILYKKKSVPDATTGGLSTVAIRMPSHPAALALIRESGVYIAAPSANKSGRPSPTTAQHVKEDLDGRIDMILDGGPVGIGIEMLSAVIGPVELDPTLAGITESENAPPCPTGNGAASPAGPQDLQHPKAPGMRYTHYAPKGELTIVSDRTTPERVTPAVKKRLQHLIREALDQGMITGIMTTGENAADYNIFKDDPHFRLILLGDTDNGQTVASHLYRALRECDDRGCERIYSENFRRDTFGSAIMNRLVKAAGHRIIYC